MKWIILSLLLLWMLAYVLLVCRNGHEKWEVLRRYHYAHRGLHGNGVPENSMEAFRKAVEHGYGAELDVHLMKDGGLAVIHDSSLKRTAGADVSIEELTRETLSAYRLENGEQIPLLEDVLALFRGRTPLIVELKAEGGNHDALSEAVAGVLDGYEGDYCIESFDPRVVRWFRKHRDHVCRGQLAMNFLTEKHFKQPLPTKLLLTLLAMNCVTRPDFVAFDFKSRGCVSLSFCRIIHRVQTVYWTIRSQKDMDEAIRLGGLCIFEGFIPS